MEITSCTSTNNCQIDDDEHARVIIMVSEKCLVYAHVDIVLDSSHACYV